MSIEEFDLEMEKNRDFQKKFGKDYKNLKKAEKDDLDLSKSMCNIWGYIKELEARVRLLENAKKE